MPEDREYCVSHEVWMDRATPCLYCVLESLGDRPVRTFEQILTDTDSRFD